MTDGRNKSDWDKDDATRYRRPRRPVEVRRRNRWKQGFFLGLRVLSVLLAVAALSAGAYSVYQTAVAAEVFRLESLEQVAVVSNQHVEAETIRDRFRGDVERPVFSISLAERRQTLEEIPWVESATVRRVFPDRLRVHIRERTPVAFLRQGSRLWLVDRYGVLLTPPEGASYSLPVLSGLSQDLPQPERQKRVELYREFVEALDRDGKGYSQQISEIDLSAPENLRVGVPAEGGVVYLLFGRDRYQEKFETYLEHRSLWQQSGEVVRAVDLRYRGQIVLNPDLAASGGSR
jgi:cell division protein FtsQ